MKKNLRNILLVAMAVGIVVWALYSRRGDPNTLVTADLLPLEVEYLSGPEIAENQPVLIDFWATWCGPCLDTIPHVNAIHAEYKDKGLQVVGISPEDPETVSKFLEHFPIDYTVAIDAEATYFTVLGIRGIPHLVLLDSEGQIVWRGHPMELKKKTIEEVLSTSQQAT